MTTKQQITRIFPHSQEKLFNLVADVRSYPTFLPWCRAVTILEEKGGELIVDLIVGHGIFQDTFRSHVILTFPEKIQVKYLKGPFHYLENYWLFEKLSEQETRVTFFIAFRFKSYFLQKMMEKFFLEATDRLMVAFEKKILESGRV